MFIPKIMILSFLFQTLRMASEALQFALKAILLNRQKNLLIFNLSILNFQKKKTPQMKTYAI